MNMFKRFVAFAIAVVMICGMMPVSASAAGTHSHDHSAHSDIQPFTGTADLIAQVQAQLVKEGAYGAGEVDQELVAAVEEMSGTAYSQAATTLAVGFFNDRIGSEGRIDTANLNLDEDTMSSLVEKTLKDYYLDGIVEVDYVVKYGVVDAVKFTMRDSFAAGLDQIESGITSNNVAALAADAEAEEQTEPVVEEIVTEPVFTGETQQTAPQTAEKPFPFTDVPDWARTAVNWLYQRGIVNGVSSTKYGSNQSVTRGQAVTMIYRAMNSPKVTGKNPFTDVKAGQYYTDAVIWAAENGVVTGTSKTTFEPNANVTREQLVTIIYRLAGEFLNMDVSEKASLSAFKDSGRISSYAQEAVKWAVGTKLVNGYTDGTFRPKNVANRAEYAQVLYKFLNMHTHELKAVAAKAATCTENGNSAYWTCSGCGKFFSDAAGTKEIAKDSWIIKAAGHKLTETKAKAPTCTETGNSAYWTCSVCGKFFSDAAGKTEVKKYSWVIEANGHKWSEWIVDEKGEHRTCEICGETQNCRHDGMPNATDVSFNWVETPDILFDEAGMPVMDAQGNYVLNPEVFFVDENGYPIMSYAMDEAGNLILDENGNPIPTGAVVVGAYPDGSAIQSLTLYLDDDNNIAVMPTRIPDIYIDWNDVDGNGVLSEEEIAGAKVHKRMAWTVSSADVLCPDCLGYIPNTNVTVEQILVDDAYIEEMAKQSAMGAMMADEAAMATFQTVMEQRMNELVPEIMGELMAGGMSQEEAQEQAQAQAQAQAQEEAFGAVLQNHPNVYMAMQQTIGQLSADYHSVLYTATLALSDTNVVTDTMNATAMYLSRSWANMCNFNEVYAKYFGAASPYWTTKNEEEGPMSAFKYVLNMQEEPVIPNFIMDYYMSMLTQAFMSYVQSYAADLDAMLADAMATVDYDELDELDIMLLMHDWLAAYGEFDMQSLVDQQTGASAGSDPITMTAFGTLLHEQLEIDGAVCLGYAATYALLLQHAFDKVSTEDPVVDFVMIKYLTNVAESSIAAGDSGFGDGDAMFNAPHFLNAVKYKDNWYYIDACYDDINSEVISQERVETDGNVSHNSFMLAPATWEDMYDGNFQLMDSLYDGKDWFRVPDGAGGYKMQDNKGTVYETEQAAKDAKDADNTLQIFYVYEPQEDTKETRYEDTTYEMAWFAGVEGAVTYDPVTQFFYYTAGAITNYSSMKDMFGEDGSMGGDDGMSMDQADMMAYKNAPNAQDKIVRRPVRAENEPEEAETNNGMTMGAPADDECEVLFHFGYGSTGSQAHAKYESDSENNNMNNGGVSDADKGAWYDDAQEDLVYVSNYPEIAHSTVMIDGKLYFNMGNAIYTFNYDVEEMADHAVQNLNDLELVKVKEYNEITYTVNQPNPQTGMGRFTGKQYVTSDSGSTVYYRPIAGLSVHKDFVNGAEGADTLHVSIATNFSNSYMTEVTQDGETVEQAYLTEARNYNPDYYRFMEDEEETDEETDEETNDNVEFMWTASIVDRMTISNFTSDLQLTTGELVTVAPYCARDGFTEERTATCGLIIPGTRTVEEDTALDHKYAMDEVEGTNICSTCLGDHEHDYTYATEDDVDIVWEVVNETELTATAVIVCGNDEFCAEDVVLKDGETKENYSLTVTKNDDDSWTATVKKGNAVLRTETKTVDALLHNIHDYGDPVFAWTEGAEGWTVTATFTCEADELDCVNSEAEGDRVVSEEYIPTNNNGELTVTVADPNGYEYTDTLHVYDEEHVEFVLDDTKTNFTATYTCTVCGATRDITGTVVKTTEAATCTETGLITYTSTASAEAVLEGSSAKTDVALPEAVGVETEEIAVLGHNYDYEKATTIWNDERTECEVTVTCARTGCEAPSTTYKLTAEKGEITSTVTPATCTVAGQTVYTATLTVENVVKGTYKITDPIAATNHPNTAVSFVWTGSDAEGYTAATAHVICQDCSTTLQTKTAAISTVVVPSTCEEAGSTTYTATATLDDGTVVTESKIVAIAILDHVWADATCDAPKTCTACGTTEGEALGHTWTAADCDTAKTCSVCGATDGEALGHTWVNADCDTPKTCSVCGATEGEALGHNWIDATCDAPKTCKDCGATEGEALGHDWVDATCETPKSCRNCTATEGTALGHAYDANTGICANCGEKDPNFHDHNAIASESDVKWVYDAENDVMVSATITWSCTECDYTSEEVASEEFGSLYLDGEAWVAMFFADDFDSIDSSIAPYGNYTVTHTHAGNPCDCGYVALEG